MTTIKKMKLSVILVSYRSEDVLKNCLDSIENYNDIGDDLEVIIVDNSPASLAYNYSLKKYSFVTKYIRNEKNTGFGGGNNIGVLNSSADIILFLNPDTILIEPIFRDVIQTIENNENTIYGFTLVSKDMKENNSFSFMYDNFFLCYMLLFLSRHKNKKFLSKPFVNKRLWAWGAAFAISKKKFIEAGMFDENIFLCNEEADLMHRIRERFVFISEHKIIHLEGHGIPVSSKRMYEFFKSRQYYFEKHGVSWFNRLMWSLHTKANAFRNSFYKTNENKRNYCQAYRDFFKNKNIKTCHLL